jgi:hypothetical protein
LGITFRTCKTFLNIRDIDVRFGDGTSLTLANETEASEFYSLRKQENDRTDFVYPRISYTVSPSDLKLPAVAPSIAYA